MIDAVQELVFKTGELLLQQFTHLSQNDISIKERGGLVTVADTAAEEMLIRGLKKIKPGSAFLAEESGEHSDSSSANHQGRWIIDPLDGTSNFANGVPWFAISVAYEATVRKEDIELGIVYNPISRECFRAEKGRGAFLNGKRLTVSGKKELSLAMLGTGFYYHKGNELSEAMGIFARMQEKVLAVRRFGAAALDLAFLAAGRFDGFWEVGLAPWDLAAGVLMIQEAGGVLCDYQGEPHSIYAHETVASNPQLKHKLLNIIQGDAKKRS